MRCLCHHRARAWTWTKTKKPLHRKFEWLFVLSLKRQFVRYVILFSGHVLTWYFENQWYFLGCFAWQELGGKHGKGTIRRDPFCALLLKGNNKQSLLGKEPGSLTLICSSCLSDISAARDVQSGPDGAKDEKMNMRDGFMTPRWSELKAVQPWK